MNAGPPMPPAAKAPGEPRWPASLALLTALALTLTLPESLTLGPTWLVPVLELSLLVPLSLRAPRRLPDEPRWERVASVALIAIVNAANAASLVLLVQVLVRGGTSGVELLAQAFAVWATNVLVFALWYWELDAGGPDERGGDTRRYPDFRFPQMETPDVAPPGWRPTFVDYLYLSSTSAMAYSPTDAMPLTAWAKLLMLAQELVSLVTITLVIARAVGILG